MASVWSTIRSSVPRRTPAFASLGILVSSVTRFIRINGQAGIGERSVTGDQDGGTFYYLCRTPDGLQRQVRGLREYVWATVRQPHFHIHQPHWAVLKQKDLAPKGECSGVSLELQVSD